MTWYNSGTVTVTNGQKLVVGSGTDFVSNVLVGWGFIGPDNRTYEIEQVVSATQIMLRRTYLGGTGAGQGYDIFPTQSLMRDLADQAATLISSFATVRDGIGAGLIADGSAPAPGLRFAGDQDTGIRRTSANAFSLVTSGVDRLIASSAGVAVGEVTNDGKAALLVQGGDQVTPALDDGGFHGASLMLRATGSGAGAGGALLFGSTFGNGSPFAALKGGVTDGAGNSIGDLHVSLRAATGNTALSHRATFTSGGAFGLGTSAPSRQMHVRGVGHAAIDIVDTGASGGQLFLQDTNGGVGSGGTLVLGTSNGNGTPFAGIRGYLGDGANNTTGDMVFCMRGSPTDTRLSARWRLSPAGNFRPALDNSFDIGEAGLRVKTYYGVSGTINTSDQRTKQQIGDVPDDWLDAWGDVRHVRFKFNDAVAEKGDGARWHVGYVAQEIRDAFIARDLDATAIGLLCHDEWGQETAPEMVTEMKVKRTPRATASTGGLLDAAGNPMVTWTYEETSEPVQVATGKTIVIREAGDLWSIRPDECAAIEAAWQRREIARQAATIQALRADVLAMQAQQ